MARPIRVEYQDGVYHVMARGNERKRICRVEKDYKLFLKTVAEMVENHGIEVYAYCFMPNHYHLIIGTPRGNLSRSIGWLQTTYTIRFNRKHGRIGHLFQGRFKAQIVDADEYGQWLVEYIHLNPVRPKDRSMIIPRDQWNTFDRFPWSSHRFYSGKQEAPLWFDLKWLSYWGKKPWKARKEYHRSIRRWFDGETENRWSELKGGFVLGDEDFFKETKVLVKGKNKMEENHWLRKESMKEVREALEKILDNETDDRIKIWAWARMGGERNIDVARRFNYGDGSAITHILKRLPDLAQKNPEILKQMLKVENYVSRFKS